MAPRLERYRPWFYAAAAYNLLWGSVAIIAPSWFFRLIGIAEPNYPALWQVLGMLLLVYALGYWWVARDPVRHRHIAVLGLLGKVLGPAGYAFAVASGQLPAAFGLTILTNDLVWWPAFVLFARDAAAISGGWRSLFRGE